MPFDVKTVPDRLKEAVRSGDLVPLVGAGVSRQAKTKSSKAFPTWAKLLTDLNNSAARKKFITPGEQRQIRNLMRTGRYLMAAQALKSEVPKDYLDNFIVERFLPDDVEPGAIHRWIFMLNSTIVLTTNYDLLLEDAYAKEHRKAARAFTFRNAPEVQCALQSFRRWVDRPMIFKLHGSVDSPSDAVLSEIDYRNLLYREPGYRNVLSALFVTKVILMIGFSFADPELQVLTESLRDSLKYRSSPDYILLPRNEKGSVEKKRLREDFGLEVLEYDPSPDHSEVLQFVQYLAKLRSKETKKGKS